MVELAIALPVLLLVAFGVVSATTILGIHQQLQLATEAAVLTAAREGTTTCPTANGSDAGPPDAATTAAFSADLAAAPDPAGRALASLTLACTPISEGTGNSGLPPSSTVLGCAYFQNTLSNSGANCVRGDFLTVTATVHVDLTWLPSFMGGLGSVAMTATAGAQDQPFAQQETP